MGVDGTVTDDNDEDYIEYSNTDLRCRYCGEHLKYHDEAFILGDCICTVAPDGVIYPPTLNDDGTGFRNNPCFFCYECWEECEDDIKEAKKDEPPVADDYAVMECDICESGIRDGEVLGAALCGEVNLSQRSPSGEIAKAVFEISESTPTILCVGCLVTMHRDILEVWDGPITQGDECEEGTMLRCWRYGCDPVCKKLRETG
jgi:hypothetical protein